MFSRKYNILKPSLVMLYGCRDRSIHVYDQLNLERYKICKMKKIKSNCLMIKYVCMNTRGCWVSEGPTLIYINMTSFSRCYYEFNVNKQSAFLDMDQDGERCFFRAIVHKCLMYIFKHGSINVFTPTAST